jgi:hypothetical protein
MNQIECTTVLGLEGEFRVLISCLLSTLHAYDIAVAAWYNHTLSTYSGDQFALTKAKPSGQIVQWPPSINQMVFNAEGKVTCFSPGYVIDNNVGTTGAF